MIDWLIDWSNSLPTGVPQGSVLIRTSSVCSVYVYNNIPISNVIQPCKLRIVKQEHDCHFRPKDSASKRCTDVSVLASDSGH